MNRYTTASLLSLICLIAALSACGDSASDDANSAVETGATSSSSTGSFFPGNTSTSGTTSPATTGTTDPGDVGSDTGGEEDTGVDTGADSSLPDVPPTNLCEPNPCTTPPANFCQSEGTVVVEYNTQGSCSPVGDDDYECTYSTATTDCVGQGLVCQSGACVNPAAPSPSPGEIVINEVMADPHFDLAEDSAEWVELTNVTSTDYALAGCTLSDEGGNTAALDGVIVPAGGFAVLTRSETDNGGIVSDGIFGFNLGNGGDSVILTCASGEIDRVAYDADFPNERARSLSLDPASTSSVANDSPNNWCAGFVTYYEGSGGGAEDNFGTPGAANPTCPPPIQPCDPNPCTDPPVASCEGDTLISYDTQGTCTPEGEEALCEYAPISTNCADSGQICVQDRCMDEEIPLDPLPTAGQVIVTEIMYDPHYDLAEDSAEWVELTNVTSGRYALTGCVVSDDGGNETTLAPITLLPNQTIVLTRTLDSASNGGINSAGTFSFGLNNTGDSFVLTCAGQEVDRVDYDADFGGGRAQSISLNPSAYSAAENDDASNWCAASDVYYNGINGDEEDNFGSPGTQNPPCPTEGDVCAPNPCTAPPSPVCEGTVATTYEPTGTCSVNGASAECSYASTSTNCADSGQSCSAGACVGGPSGDSPNPGQIIVTEIMFDPHFDLSDNDAEWFELTNVSSQTLNLQGCTVSDDGGNTVDVATSLPIGPGSSLLFARSAEDNGGLNFDFLFSFALGNSGDALILSCGGQMIDTVNYGAAGFPAERARSISLDPAFNSAAQNDLGENWCLGQDVYYNGINGAEENNFGTPRSSNTSCP